MQWKTDSHRPAAATKFDLAQKQPCRKGYLKARAVMKLKPALSGSLFNIPTRTPISEQIIVNEQKNGARRANAAAFFVNSQWLEKLTQLGIMPRNFAQPQIAAWYSGNCAEPGNLQTQAVIVN